jgi:hypothetical protein
MPSPLETVLTSVGVPAEDIATIVALKETDTFDPKAVAEKVRSNYRTQFQNDPAFFNELTVDKLPADTRKKIESDQYGRAAGIVKQKFYRTLGLTDAEIAGLTEDQKNKLEEFVPAVAEMWTKTKSGDKATQEQLIEARKQLEALNGIEEKMKTKYQSESDTKVTAGIFNAVLLGELAQLQGLKISAADIAATASNVLLAKYNFERVGDYGIELRQKENPKMKVLKGNTSHELTLKDALAEIAEQRGWIEAAADDANDKQGGGKLKVKPDGKGALSFLPPHLQTVISNKIAAEK